MKENIKKNLLFTILVIAKYWIRAKQRAKIC